MRRRRARAARPILPHPHSRPLPLLRPRRPRRRRRRPPPPVDSFIHSFIHSWVGGGAVRCDHMLYGRFAPLSSLPQNTHPQLQCRRGPTAAASTEERPRKAAGHGVGLDADQEPRERRKHRLALGVRAQGGGVLCKGKMERKGSLTRFQSTRFQSVCWRVDPSNQDSPTHPSPHPRFDTVGRSWLPPTRPYGLETGPTTASCRPCSSATARIGGAAGVRSASGRRRAMRSVPPVSGMCCSTSMGSLLL